MKDVRREAAEGIRTIDKMPVRRYRVQYRFSDYGSVVVEAPTPEDAEAIVEDIDGALLPTEEQSGDFSLTETSEVSPGTADFDELTWPDGPPTDAAREAKRAAEAEEAARIALIKDPKERLAAQLGGKASLYWECAGGYRTSRKAFPTVASARAAAMRHERGCRFVTVVRGHLADGSPFHLRTDDQPSTRLALAQLARGTL